MKKINKYIHGSHKIAFCVVTLLVLMIFLLNFSQMIMETYAYSCMVSNNEINKKTVSIKKIFEMKEENEKKNKKKIQKEKDQAGSNVNTVSVSQKNMAGFLIKPVNGGITTSVFGDTEDRSARHLGHDWAVDIGTEVFAAADGEVEKSYYSTSYGYNILINHDNGLQTRYAHLSELLVITGLKVKQGDRIGLSGNTGDSTGPHIHFEVIENGNRVNPLKFLE